MLRIRIGIRIRSIHVFGPPGSGSFSQRCGYGSGSGSSYHQAKIGRKTLIPAVLWLLYDFLSLKNNVLVNVHSKSNKQKNLGKKLSKSAPKFHGSATLVSSKQVQVHPEIQDGQLLIYIYVGKSPILHTYPIIWPPPFPILQEKVGLRPASSTSRTIPSHLLYIIRKRREKYRGNHL